MTVQKRVTIEPFDIVAVEYECRKCETRYSVPIKKIQSSQMKCPQCEAEWIRGHYEATSRDARDYAVANFAEALKAIQSIANEVRIRLEISVAPDPESSVSDPKPAAK